MAADEPHERCVNTLAGSNPGALAAAFGTQAPGCEPAAIWLPLSSGFGSGTHTLPEASQAA